MKKSIGLLSALVVTTTFIVNCQKAPEKRRVQPSGGSGVQSDVVEKVKLPTKVCSKQIIEAYTSLYNGQLQLKNNALTATSNEADKEAYKKLGVETLAKCDDIIKLLQVEENQGCYRDADVKDISNAYTVTNLKNACNSLGKKLKTEVELDNSYANAAQARETKINDENQLEELKGKPWSITNEGLALFVEGNTNLGRFIIDGEIKTSSIDLEQALTTSKTVCTVFSKNSVVAAISSELTNEVYISQFAKAEDDIIKELNIDFNGKATLLPVVLKHKSETGATTASMVCLNMDSEKLTADVVKKALGSVIRLQAAQVSTEVTGNTSETVQYETNVAPVVSETALTSNLVVAQPAVSATIITVTTAATSAAVAASSTVTTVTTTTASRSVSATETAVD